MSTTNYRVIGIDELKECFQRTFELFDGASGLQNDFNKFIKEYKSGYLFKKIYRRKKLEFFIERYTLFYRAFFYHHNAGEKKSYLCCEMCSIRISEIQNMYLVPINYKITLYLALGSILIGLFSTIYSVHVNIDSSKIQAIQNERIKSIIDQSKKDHCFDSINNAKLNLLKYKFDSISSELKIKSEFNMQLLNQLIRKY